jgi:type II secretory pathway pseudopilin PulG
VDFFGTGPKNTYYPWRSEWRTTEFPGFPVTCVDHRRADPVIGRTIQADALPPRGPTRRDAGVSFIELLVAIVLVGMAVVGTLAAVRATVIGSRLERDHSRAQAWLQSAMEELQSAERVGCDPVGDPPSVPDVRGLYEETIQVEALGPDGWDPQTQLSITSVQYWDGSTYQSQCFDDAGFRLQLVTIQVTSPDGEVLEDVAVVKDTPDLPLEEGP